MAFDSVPEESTDVAQEAPEVPDTMPEGPEGESLSLDIFGDKEPAVGDMVILKVTAIDPENGRVTVVMPEAGKKMGGIAGQAAALDEEPI